MNNLFIYKLRPKHPALSYP